MSRDGCESGLKYFRARSREIGCDLIKSELGLDYNTFIIGEMARCRDRAPPDGTGIVAASFKWWTSNGFRIDKGAKCTMWDPTGAPGSKVGLFSEHQVWDTKSRYEPPRDYGRPKRYRNPEAPYPQQDENGYGDWEYC